MKNVIFSLTLIFILPGFSFAQTTVGFSDPDDTQPLLDYRLPDWGYSNFFLDFSLNGFSNRSDISSIGSDVQKNRSANINVAPRFNLYRESEQRIYNLRIDAFLNYDHQYLGRGENEGNRDISNEFRSTITAQGDFRKYLEEKGFIYGSEIITLGYRSQKDSESIGQPTEEEISRIRNISNETQLGFGLGRVRNVSPVIRTLRMRERANVLGQDLNFSSNDLQNIADQFTRYEGYQTNYDRPAKYFWNDMDQNISQDLNSLNPFDLLYLTDVLDETIGMRLQGKEIIAGGDFSYSNDLMRNEQSPADPGFERTLQVNTFAGFFIKGRWYNNLSLNHQIGVSGEAVHGYRINRNPNILWQMNISSQFEWLWSIADRFLLRSTLSTRYNGHKAGGDAARRTWTTDSGLNVSAIFFLENHLAFNLTPSYFLAYSGNTENEAAFSIRTSFFYINAGLRYYFDRNLY